MEKQAEKNKDEGLFKKIKTHLSLTSGGSKAGEFQHGGGGLVPALTCGLAGRFLCKQKTMELQVSACSRG